MRRSMRCANIFVLVLTVIGYSVPAQVPVREEPRHKVALENEYVRLLDVHIPPGDTTLYHTHAAPSVIVVLTKAITGSQIMGESPSAPGQTMPGNTWFPTYDKNPVTHRVFNAGKDTFHVMDIELVKEKPDSNNCTITNHYSTKLLLEEKLVRCYKLTIKHAEQYQFPQNSCAYLLIDISGTAQTNAVNGQHTIQAGEFIFFKAERSFQIDNNGKENAECVVLELK